MLIASCITRTLHGFPSFFETLMFVVGCVPFETTSGQADDSCSRVAAPRRSLVARALFLVVRAAQPSEYEDQLGNR